MFAYRLLWRIDRALPSSLRADAADRAISQHDVCHSRSSANRRFAFARTQSLPQAWRCARDILDTTTEGRARRGKNLAGRRERAAGLLRPGLVLYGEPPYNSLDHGDRENRMATTAQLRQERLEARITKSQKRLFEKAATLKGTSVSQFVIASAQEAAVRTLEGQQILKLGRRDQELFVRALLSPTSPGKRLRAAVARHGYSQSIGKA